MLCSKLVEAICTLSGIHHLVLVINVLLTKCLIELYVLPLGSAIILFLYIITILDGVIGLFCFNIINNLVIIGKAIPFFFLGFPFGSRLDRLLVLFHLPLLQVDKFCDPLRFQDSIFTIKVYLYFFSFILELDNL